MVSRFELSDDDVCQPAGDENHRFHAGDSSAEAVAGTPSHSYRLSIGMQLQNILNHNNPGPIIGNITSPLFGRANQPFGSGGFGGFSEAANNRRLELQTRFTF